MEAGGHVPVGFWGVWVLWGGRGGEFFLILGGGGGGGFGGCGWGGGLLFGVVMSPRGLLVSRRCIWRSGRVTTNDWHQIRRYYT